jgi:hypothetical protein
MTATKYVTNKGRKYVTAAARTHHAVCPFCGQAMPVMRLGKELWPLTARIFDLIQSAGADGIAARELFERTYSFTSSKPRFAVLNTHIRLIRRAIEPAWTIVATCDTDRTVWVYKLAKRTTLPRVRTGGARNARNPPTVPAVE